MLIEDVARTDSQSGFKRIHPVAEVGRYTPGYEGDSMFVGFDSQNTSHSFLHYTNWNLWVLGIPRIWFRDYSEN